MGSRAVSFDIILAVKIMYVTIVVVIMAIISLLNPHPERQTTILDRELQAMNKMLPDKLEYSMTGGTAIIAITKIVTFSTIATTAI